MPSTHRRRDSTRQLRRVGVGGVYRVLVGSVADLCPLMDSLVHPLRSVIVITSQLSFSKTSHATFHAIYSAAENTLCNKTARDRKQRWRAARAAPHRACVGRHLANRREMRVSGSDSYALLFLLCETLYRIVSLSYQIIH